MAIVSTVLAESMKLSQTTTIFQACFRWTVKTENIIKWKCTPGNTTQTAQQCQLDTATDAMSESEDNAEAKHEAESLTQSTEIKNYEEKTAEVSVSSARHF